MKQGRTQEHITSLAALLLLAVFAVSILLTLLEGADLYRRLTDRDRESWQARSAFLYLSTRLRQEDRLGAISVEEFDGRPALTLGAGEEYVTRLYCYDGSLWELYSPAELELAQEDGERLLDLAGMEPTLSEGLLRLDLTGADGQTQQLTLALRGGEEGGR